MSAVLDLTAGSALMLGGAEWTVERLEPQYGVVVLTHGDGQRMRVSVRFLISHPGCRASSRSADPAPSRQSRGAAGAGRRSGAAAGPGAGRLPDADPAGGRAPQAGGDRVRR